MHNCEPLAWYGAFILLLTGGMILIPYLRGKADLISAWNIFLLGIAIFIGIGCFEAATTPLRFPGLSWFNPTKAEVNRWLIYTTTFLVVLFATYRFDPLSKKLAARSFNKWPPYSTKVALFVIITCFVLAAAAQVNTILAVPFVGQVVLNTSHKAFVFCCTFSFVLWYRNRTNIAWLGLFLGAFLFLCIMAMVVAQGRRLLLSLLVVPVLVVYFYDARRWRPTKGMAAIAVGVLVLFIMNLMYTSIRHFDRRGEKAERTAANVVKEVGRIGQKDWFGRFANDALWHFSQQVVHYGMLTDRFVSTGQLEEKPFNTFKFFLVYPVPRVLYPEKPVSLGRTITHDVLNRNTSWGTGVQGHSAYEGGVIIAAMFGYFAGFGVRFFVDPLRRQPTNPFLIGMLAAASTQLLAWPRGDLSVMTFETVECLLFTFALSLVCRFLFGTERAQMPMQMPSTRYPLMHRAPAR
jgi:hypothetical protein